MGSTAGVFPVPGMVIDGSSKYAINGLSYGMRIEAQDLGVKVSVVTAIIGNTPLYDPAIYIKLDKKCFLKSRHFVQQLRGAAKWILEDVKKNRAYRKHLQTEQLNV